MKVLSLMVLIGLSHLALHASDATMTKDERAKALAMLRDSQAEFLSAVNGVSDAQWSWKSAADRWSIAEVAEHLMLAEDAMFGRIQTALAGPALADWEAKTASKTAMLLRYLPDRSGKVQAPEAIRPQAKLTRAEIMQHYQESRARTIKFAEETAAPLKEHTSDNPFFGPLNAYQWLIYIPLHNVRHNQQIAEVKATDGFPK